MARLCQLAAALSLSVAALAGPAVGAHASNSEVYVVKTGDSLASIAANMEVGLGDLLSLNNLTVSSLIVPGQRLALPAGADPPSATTSGSIGVVIDYALAQLGKPYRFFTSGPDRFDCSGLTMAAYARVGISLVHYSAYQARQARAVDFLHTSIQPGDLVFLDTNGDGGINHVGMAINATTWIQAPGPGDIVRLGALPPKGLIVAVRRYIPAG